MNQRNALFCLFASISAAVFCFLHAYFSTVSPSAGLSAESPKALNDVAFRAPKQPVALRSPAPTKSSAMNQPVRVELTHQSDRWQLLRNAAPYRVKGAGGDGSLKLLAQSGANSVRSWGVDENTRSQLDEAHANGLSMTVGLWLGHERHGMDYTDYDSMIKQIDQTLEHVRALKDHPAVLVWGLGNEMEGAGDNPAIYSHIEYLAQRIKSEDPNHPVMTVIAEIGGKKIEAIHKLCPSIDIIGINSYGGADSLPTRYKELGGTKPYIVTEFGPIGTWEAPKNTIDAIVEPSSDMKADNYRAAAQAFADDQSHCLGSYAFVWGNKQEGTSTWFGMLTADGKRTASVDTMQEIWTGSPPDNRCPVIQKLELKSKAIAKAGDTVEVALSVSDPDNDPVSVNWTMTAEADSYITGGDAQKSPKTIEGAIVTSNAQGATIKMPATPGIYRIYAIADDGENGGAATANVTVLVEGSKTASAPTAGSVKLPLVILDEPDAQKTEAGDPLYAASGFMGLVDAISVVDDCPDDPKFGDHCTEVTFRRGDNWGGVVWQNPANDWGKLPGGFNLTGATKLTFWARGAKGGETVKFGMGVIGRDQPFFDTGKKEKEINLTEQWTQYTIDLDGANLERIKTGFFFSLAGQGTGVTFYLDRIQYQ